MASSGIERRIFVVGVPRSGTTLVQSLLAAHSGVASFTESHLFSRHFSLVPFSDFAILTRNPLPRLHEFLEENGVTSAGFVAEIEGRVRRRLGGGLMRPFRSRDVAEELLRAFDRLADSRGSSTWVEKTPRHLRYLPFLSRISGGSETLRFVHVVRQGLETVASLHAASRRWERPYDLSACVRRWNSEVGFSLARVSVPSDAFVFYEDLTGSPEEVSKRLFGQLGLEWEPEVLERYGEASGRLITASEAWKDNVSRAMRPSSTSVETLSEEQRARVMRSLRHDLYTELHRRTI